MKPAIILFVFFLFMLIIPKDLFSQSEDSLANYYYKLGIASLKKHDYDSARDFLNKSLKEKETAPAEYQLAIAYKADTSHTKWNYSREHIKKAIKLDPDNPEYHLFYGIISEDLYNYSYLEFDSIEDAIRQYKITISLDSTNTIASERLGKILADRFLEYNNSINLGGTDVSNSYQQFIRLGKKQSSINYNLFNFPDGYTTYDSFAGDAFKIAESAYINAIKYDSLNPAPYLKLAPIYEDNKEPEKGIKFLQKLTGIHPDNKDGHLYLALLYYRSDKIEPAYEEFKTAISLMSQQEKEDFIYNSVKVMLEPMLGDKLEEMDNNTLKKVVDYFWKIRDPLDLTDYNERLLEHYARVAYSNLRFRVPKLNMPSWKTDRGKIVIRYGIPPARKRIRANALSGNTTVRPKTEVWNYGDKSFSFVDQFMNKDYVLGIPGQSQYWDDSQKLSYQLLRTLPEEYNPKFVGPVFSTANESYQFKDFTNPYSSDLFISYGIKPDQKIQKDKDYEYDYTLGIFYFDVYYNKIAEYKNDLKYLNPKNEISVPDSGLLLINTKELIARPDSGNLSFEIIRKSDNGVSTYHRKFRLRNFDKTNLDISDIVLASGVSEDFIFQGRINRGEYSILPNPTNTFSSSQEMYIYYEVYNLEKDDNGSTDFEQTVLMKKSDDEEVSIGKLVGSVLKFIGLKDRDQEVSLTANYRTKDKDSRIYLQLDMSDYEPGNYLLTVKIKDKISGNVKENSVKLTWK